MFDSPAQPISFSTAESFCNRSEAQPRLASDTTLDLKVRRLPNSSEHSAEGLNRLPTKAPGWRLRHTQLEKEVRLRRIDQVCRGKDAKLIELSRLRDAPLSPGSSHIFGAQ
jgi:hypothetical protein